MARITEFITFVFVSDLEVSHHFYTRVLGLELVLDQTNCRIYRVTTTGLIGICERPDQMAPGGLILTLVVDDVDEAHRRITAAGGVAESAPQHSEQYGIYHAFYRDPDGHLIEIQRFDHPNWNELN